MKEKVLFSSLGEEDFLCVYLSADQKGIKEIYYTNSTSLSF